MGVKIEITRDFRHYRAGQIIESTAMLREYLFSCNAAKLMKVKTRGRPRKCDTGQTTNPKNARG
jgi:hypothetical protein